ncbi:hypothetical protein G9A89_012940 [Geosiphon pyriformis]|nr:hypothetical protein G9A89_012940 [Geosiphon pyriformis]
MSKLPTKIFKGFGLPRIRFNVTTESVAENAVKAMNLKDDVTVIEAHTGFGVLSQALLKNSKVKKVLAFEFEKKLHPRMQALAANSQGRLEFFPYSLTRYVSHDKLAQPLAHISKHQWIEPHPSLVFIGQVPMSIKENLLNTLMNLLATKSSFFVYGRVEMYLLCPEALAKRILPNPTDEAKSTTNVIIHALTTSSLLMKIPKENVQPEETGEVSLLRITPLLEAKLDESNWETYRYVTRLMYSVPKKPLSKVIRSLAAGAEELLPKLSFDPDIPTGLMSLEQMCELTTVFDKWHLRPIHLDEKMNDHSRRL